MDLFKEKTELEEICTNLIRAIRKSKINQESKKYLTTYLNEIKEERRNNDFYDLDFLSRVILEIISKSDLEQNILETEFQELINLTKFLLPLGPETENYEGIKYLILNSNRRIEPELYALFDNRLDYFHIINILEGEQKLNSKDIIDYAKEVSPYCINQTQLKSEIISFINGLSSELDDIQTYKKSKLEEAKKRCGIYPVDEKTLALISSEAKRAQALIEKLDVMKTYVDQYGETIKTLTEKGEQNISEYSSQKVSEMKDNILKVQNELTTRLDEYLLKLENELRDDKEKIFNQILEEANQKLREINLTIRNMTSTTTGELLRLQKASEESITKLKNYVEKEPELQQLLKESVDQETIKEALIKFGEFIATKEGKNIISTEQNIVIPGNERIIMPASPKVIIPQSEPQYNILEAFDESIPFNVRKNKILEQKKQREDNGELFHSLIDEVIIDVLEGDWVYLWGPSGCGKSHLMKQVSSLVGLDFVDNGKITDKYSVMAYNDPHGRFRATQAFIALAYGKMLILDEMDNGNPDTQVILGGLYSGLLDTIEDPNQKSYITFAEDMTVPVHPNFRMISAGNTPGEGENQVFSSRGKIDEAILERMTPKKFDYDNRLEQRIFGSYENWYKLFVNFRLACDEYAKESGLFSTPGMITTRDASAITRYINHNSKSIDQILDEKFIQTKNSAYITVIERTIRSIYNIPTNDEDIKLSPNTLLSEIPERVLARRLVRNCNIALENQK